MKGIILAGGTGTRLHPLTISTSKQLMPVYDKPMIYYPLSVLLLVGIKEILIITKPNEEQAFRNLLGDGSQLGCHFTYATQSKPEGLAQAFIIGESFIGDEAVALILGDNIFYGTGLKSLLKEKIQLVENKKKNNSEIGYIFAYHVNDPKRYGVVEFDENNQVLSITEKPKYPKSNFAIPGIYFFDKSVVEKAKSLTLSLRGEYEITDINKLYLKENNLYVGVLDRGIAWLDTGTFDSLIDAAKYVQVIEQRQGLKIGCLEEIAYTEQYINKKQLKKLILPLLKSGYGQYLNRILKDK